MMDDHDLDRLVDDRTDEDLFRVHRSALTSPAIYDLEMERIFNQVWLYVGHESEVAEPGSYVRRSVGGRPVLLVHGLDGTLRAFFNSCPHRGAAVCRQDRGTTRSFQCFYHSWTFDTLGKFKSGPTMDHYGPSWPSEAMNLAAVPRLDSYRGLVFICYREDIEDLIDYLGPACEYIDLVMDQGEEGMTVLPGEQRYAVGANWKLLVENSVDSYHATPLHSTYFKYMAESLKEAGGEIDTSSQAAGFGRPLGNGHMAMDVRRPYARPVARWGPLMGAGLDEEIQVRREALLDKHGPTRAYRIAEVTSNLVIYPNLVINDGVAVTIRKVDPAGVGRLESTAWALAPVGESPELTERRLDSFLTFYGPGGFATPDDVEALESCQRGFAAGAPEWSDLSRGIGAVPTFVDEAAIRGFWRVWHGHLTGRAPQNTEEGRYDVDWDEIVDEWGHSLEEGR